MVENLSVCFDTNNNESTANPWATAPNKIYNLATPIVNNKLDEYVIAYQNHVKIMQWNKWPNIMIHRLDSEVQFGSPAGMGIRAFLSMNFKPSFSR